MININKKLIETLKSRNIPLDFLDKNKKTIKDSTK
jgi:hypothetical protein